MMVRLTVLDAHRAQRGNRCLPTQVCNELAATIIENGVVRQATPEELAKAKVGAPPTLAALWGG